jgi:hypothetical protein
MSKIHLNLPPQAKIVGALYGRTDRNMLDQDMLYVELPDSIFICVGWHPDLDPNGEYRLLVFHEMPSQPLEPAVHTKDVRKIKSEIYRLVKTYLPQLASGSAAMIPPLFANGTVGPSPAKVIENSIGTVTRYSKVFA